MAGDSDIVIVGGGIYGAALALDLAGAGRRVTLLERATIAAGASGGPGERGVRAVNRDIRELPVAELALARWRELQSAVAGGVGYRRVGSIHVFDNAFGHRASDLRATLDARAQVQEAMGIATRVVGRDELLALEPELNPGVAGGLHCPDDGVADHAFATRRIAALAAEAGAMVREHAEVAELLCAGGRAVAVRLADGERVAVGEHLIVVANGGTPALLRPLLGPDELLPTWQIIPQMQYVSNPGGRTVRHLLSHVQRRLAVKQLADGTFMLSGGWSVERDAAGATRGTLSAMSLSLQDALALFPFLEQSTFLSVDSTRSDTCALDGIPLIGRPRGCANLTYGFGWSGHGFAISLGMARLIAGWVTSGVKPPLLAPFAPERFQRSSAGAATGGR